MSVELIRANARNLPIADSSVDLIVTSPPYFGLRSYQDGGEHYAGQLGDEATPAEFIDSLIECTREMVRVLKPSGSIWVNLGDKYARTGGCGRGSSDGYTGRGPRPATTIGGVPEKSLIGIPWRYAIRCIDDLGLILRAEVIWSKPNGLPESVTDRVRRSHEQWFHMTLNPRYYSAVDRIREAHASTVVPGRRFDGGAPVEGARRFAADGSRHTDGHPLGSLPGSVWTIPTQPLQVPDHLGVDHYAAYPTEWPRRLILGWSPEHVCTACGEGLRPTTERTPMIVRPSSRRQQLTDPSLYHQRSGTAGTMTQAPSRIIIGEACACPEPTAPTTPGVVLDPFGGTGTTALCADVLGRHGISVDMSADYLRIAQWRTTDPKQRAKAARTEHKPPVEVPDGQATFDFTEGATA